MTCRAQERNGGIIKETKTEVLDHKSQRPWEKDREGQRLRQEKERQEWVEKRMRWKRTRIFLI